MPYVRRCRPPGVILACVLISCSDSSPPAQDSASDTDPVPTSTSSGPDVSATAGSSSADTSSGSSTTPSTTDGSESTSSADTSGGTVPRCCSADCSPCQDNCSFETLDQSRQADTVEGMAVFGDQVYWAGGFSAELRRYDTLTGEAQSLGTFDHGIHTLAANQDAIYFGTRSSSHLIIGSVDPATGESSVLWDFGPDGPNTGSGQLALDETHLYFSASDSLRGGAGGVFRIPLSGGKPELIAQSDTAVGLGLDDDHVFFTDAMNARVFSLAKDDIGTAVDPTMLSYALDPGELFVDDDFIYFTSSTGLDRISKDGDDFARVLETSSSVFALAGDETHLYATILQKEDRLVRIELGTEDPEIVVIEADPGVAVVVNCDSVFWVNPQGELRRRPK